MARILVICETCGSEDVYVDAWMAWDKYIQVWELSATFPNGWCNNCDTERSLLKKQEVHPN